MKSLTLDELEEREELLAELDPDNNPHVKRQLINVYEQMLMIMRRKKETRTDLYAYIKRNMVTQLIQYGAFLKFQDEKNFKEAETNFKLALKYEPINPIANYRLGFIKYSNRYYPEAAAYFNESLIYQKCVRRNYIY